MGMCHVLKIILLFVTINHSFPVCFPLDISHVMQANFETNTVTMTMKAWKTPGVWCSEGKQNQTMYTLCKAK